jgi:hypothetical protein
MLLKTLFLGNLDVRMSCYQSHFMLHQISFYALPISLYAPPISLYERTHSRQETQPETGLLAE